MKNNMKKYGNIALAIALALAIVVGVGAFTKDARLKANEEEPAAEVPAPVAEPVEVYQEVNYPAEEAPAAEAPAEEATSDAEMPADADTAADEQDAEAPADEDADIDDADEAESEEDAEEAEEEEEEEDEEDGKLSVSIYPQLISGEDFVYGSTVMFTSSVSGGEGKTLHYQWEYSLDGANYQPIPGANGSTYTFVLDEATGAYFWHLHVVAE